MNKHSLFANRQSSIAHIKREIQREIRLGSDDGHAQATAYINGNLVVLQDLGIITKEDYDTLLTEALEALIAPAETL